MVKKKSLEVEAEALVKVMHFGFTFSFYIAEVEHFRFYPSFFMVSIVGDLEYTFQF